MPTQFRVEALFKDVNAREYFLERDGAMFRNLAMKMLKLRKMEFLGAPQIDTQTCKACLATRPDFGRYVPQRWVDWLTGDQLEFVDEIEYRADLLQGPKYTLLVKCVLPWLAKKADINCRLSFEQQGRDCRQVLEGQVHIKMPGIGRLAEPLIVNGLRQAYADLPKLLTDWMAQRESVLATGAPAQLLTGRPEGLPGPVLDTIHDQSAAAHGLVHTAPVTPAEQNATSSEGFCAAAAAPKQGRNGAVYQHVVHADSSREAVRGHRGVEGMVGGVAQQVPVGHEAKVMDSAPCRADSIEYGALAVLPEQPAAAV